MLKYKFIAQYSDGTIYRQNDEDVSITDPVRSSYYDVAHDKLIGFILQDIEDHSYFVDLLDGHFEINEIPFKLTDVEVTNRRLIYFRRHLHHFGQLDGVEQSHTIAFHVGWQGNDKEGKNVQHTLIIS